MRIVNDAIAGTLESSDVMVRVSPHDELEVIVASTVEAQYGDAIRSLIGETLSELGVAAGRITVDDKGALDCTLKARLMAAVARASDHDVDWSTL